MNLALPSLGENGMPKLTDKQRDRMSSISSDIGKIIWAALVVGQFIPGAKEELSFAKIVIGLSVSGMCWAFSVSIVKEKVKHGSD